MSEPTEISFSILEDDDLETIVDLWMKCGLTRPHNDPHTDIAFARAQPNADILVGKRDGNIVASVMVGHDGHRGTVYYVCVDPDCQTKGLGRRTMAAAEDWLQQRGVWKLNLVIREENEKVFGFYEALGYEKEPRILMSRWIDPSKKPA